jgi:hypothetical protein
VPYQRISFGRIPPVPQQMNLSAQVKALLWKVGNRDAPSPSNGQRLWPALRPMPDLALWVDIAQQAMYHGRGIYHGQGRRNASANP